MLPNASETSRRKAPREEKPTKPSGEICEQERVPETMASPLEHREGGWQGVAANVGGAEAVVLCNKGPCEQVSR